MSRNQKFRISGSLFGMSRLLLFVFGLLIAIIPVSERYCALDNFPKGQDFETNLVALLAVFGLMLLFAHLCRKAFAGLFSEPHELFSCIASRSPSYTGCAHAFARWLAHRVPLPDPAYHPTNLQLLI